MFTAILQAIELEVRFVAYFFDLNRPERGFPVDERSARWMFGRGMTVS